MGQPLHPTRRSEGVVELWSRRERRLYDVGLEQLQRPHDVDRASGVESR